MFTDFVDECKAVKMAGNVASTMASPAGAFAASGQGAPITVEA